jgi:hypothetical protein
MSKQSDWLPRNRAEQLAMADNWITVCTTRQTAQNETTRTPAKRLCLLARSLAA